MQTTGSSPTTTRCPGDDSRYQILRYQLLTFLTNQARTSDVAQTWFLYQTDRDDYLQIPNYTGVTAGTRPYLVWTEDYEYSRIQLPARRIHIVFSGEYEDGPATFYISDDGKGIDEDALYSINHITDLPINDGKNVGIKNSIYRLKYYYGEEE